MLSNTYFADSSGICPADVDLLNRLRLMQDRLDQWLEPAAEDPEPLGSPGSGIDSGIGSGIGSDLQRAPSPVDLGGHSGSHRLATCGEARREVRQETLLPPVA